MASVVNVPQATPERRVMVSMSIIFSNEAHYIHFFFQITEWHTEGFIMIFFAIDNNFGGICW